MIDKLDKYDLAILDALQRDADQSVEQIAANIGLTRNPCWRRIKQLETRGVIRKRVALLEPQAIGVGLLALIMIRVRDHDPAWLGPFKGFAESRPEIVSAYRMAGDIDYVLRVALKDVASYDTFYQRLIRALPVADVSASFVMDSIKEDTALPLSG